MKINVSAWDEIIMYDSWAMFLVKWKLYLENKVVKR